MSALALASILLFQGGAPQGGPALKNVRKDQWDVVALLPDIKGSKLQLFANRDVSTLMRKDFNDFLANARTDRKELPHLPPFGYESQASVHYSSSKFVSVSIGTYRFAGGAHGMSTTECLNYATIGGKPRRTTWKDVFATEHRKDLELLLLGLALKEERADWIQDGGKNSFTDAELSNFHVYRGYGLIWEFDAYALGSYASGPFSFVVPWKTVAPYLRANGPLAGIR